MLPIYHMATMPPRIEALKDSVPSILPQCRHLHIYLNNFAGYIPKILRHRKITCYTSEDHLGDLGDVGKFYMCDSWDPGYHLTVDDKIIYPPDYTSYMTGKVEQYRRRACISLHGRNFHRRKCKSYYYDNKEQFSCFLTTTERYVHEIGTGVMAFHTDTFTPEFSWFPYTNMTDILLSIALQKMAVPMVIANHRQGYIRLSNRHDDNHSIHNYCNKKDTLHTDLINSIRWKIYTV